MFDIITIGGATRDITFLTDKGRVIETPENLTEQSLLAFEYGAKIKSEEVFFNFGGGACNTAATFSKLGLNVSAICRVGDDEDGKCAIRNLSGMKIDTSLIQIDKKRKTGFSLIVVNKKDGDRVIFVYKGASDFLEISESSPINKGKWIYLTSLAGDWMEKLGEVGEVIEEGNVKLVWNPGAAQIAAGKNKLEKFFKLTEILIVNKDEAIELVGSDESLKLDYNEINNIEVLSKAIKKWGPAVAVITDGINGAYLYAGGENVLYSPATSKKRVDTTGAGDAFGSAFVGGYILTGNLETALKYGIINSGNVVSEYGAQNGILERGEIEKRLDGVKVSWL